MYLRDRKSTNNKGKGIPKSPAVPFNVHSLCHFHKGIANKKVITFLVTFGLWTDNSLHEIHAETRCKVAYELPSVIFFFLTS